MKYNNLLLTLVLLLLANGSFAADYLSVEDVSMKAGDKKKIEIWLNNSSTFMAFQFDLVLPEGISIAKNKKGKDDITFNEDRIDDHTVTVSETSSGVYTFISFSMSNSEFYENEGALLYVMLKADESLSGNISVGISNITFSDLDRNRHTLDDISFNITVQALPSVSLADNVDNTSIIGSNNADKVNATLAGYTLFKDGDWNTLCLPFSLDAAAIAASGLAGAELMELDITDSYEYSDGNHVTGIADNGKLYLNFKTATNINAGTPYIIRWTGTSGEISSPIFYGVTIDNSATAIARKTVSFTGGQFIGIYAPVVYDDGAEHPEVLLLGSNNELFWPDGTNTSDVTPFHAYFLLESPIGNARSVALNLSDEGTTGIKLIGDPQFACDNDAAVWYTIDGRKLSGKPTKKGMFINKGKKVVVK